jgi:hypothetical protein
MTKDEASAAADRMTFYEAVKVIMRLTLNVAQFSTKQALQEYPGRAC